jgi:group I intron endonuclease
LVSHWLQFQTEEPFVPNLDKFGFVYIITKIQNDKAYVGCKQYFVGKTKKQMKWETYTGSSKYLNADIEKDGKEKFKFEVIAEYINKRSLRYYEAYYQMKWDVLTATLKDSDEQAFYNGYVGGKFYRPIESYTSFTEEHKKKLSEGKIGEKNPMFGKNFTEEHKKKMSDSVIGEKNHMFGKKHTEETKKIMSESHKGRKFTEETRKKMSESHKGKKFTEETRKKISDSLKGRKFTEEHKNNISESKKKKGGNKW